MSTDKAKTNKEQKGKKEETQRYDENYPENGDNFSTGKPDASPLPNNPAKNEELEAPDEDKS